MINTLKAINSLIIPSDNNIGKYVVFKEKKSLGELHRKHIFKIYACQKVWGYNEQGIYTFPVQGYRVYAIDDREIDFPCAREEILFLN